MVFAIYETWYWKNANTIFFVVVLVVMCHISARINILLLPKSAVGTWRMTAAIVQLEVFTCLWQPCPEQGLTDR